MNLIPPTCRALTRFHAHTIVERRVDEALFARVRRDGHISHSKKRNKEKRNRSLGSSKWQPRRRTGLTSFVSLSTSEMSLPRRATKEKKVGKKRWIRVFIATAQYIFCEHGTIGPTFPPFSGSNSVRLATIQL